LSDRGPRLHALLLAGLALLAAGCSDSSSSSQASELAFVTSRDGDYAIYVMSADGQGQKRLTPNASTDGVSLERVFFQIDPAWSPDGRRIAFASKRSGTFDIFLMDADGGGERRLASTRDDESHPTWSPDSKQIAFQRGLGDIYVMDADGSAAHRISQDPAAEIHPAWSPDGRWIAYVRHIPGSPVRELWLVRPNGTERRQLTRLAAESFEPAWSPDGKRIAFSSASGGTGFDIYTTDVDGKGLRRVTRSAADESEPAWSPDGKTIAFNRDGAIVVAELGGRERRLTEAADNDGSPAWRPQS
jgi:TolB protein